MNSDLTKQSGSTLQIDLNGDQGMTIVPKPVQKPFRRVEIAAGLLCISAGLWLLVGFIGFSIDLLRSGYIALVFWMLAIAILVTLPLTSGIFG